jgi:acyl dehydratase
MPIFKNAAAVKNAIGQNLGKTPYQTITQEMVAAFSAATSDFQWIHLDLVRAQSETPFGGTIVQGFLTISLASKFIEELLVLEEKKMFINYGSNRVRFTDVVPVGSRISMSATIKGAEDFSNGGVKILLDVVFEREGSTKPICIAELIWLLF